MDSTLNTGVEEHFFGDAFDARPLKEVDDNVGTYSSADDDINYSKMVEGGAQRPLSGRTKPAGTAIPASNSISLTPKDAGSVLEFSNSISQSGKVEAKTFLYQLMMLIEKQYSCDKSIKI